MNCGLKLQPRHLLDILEGHLRARGDLVSRSAVQTLERRLAAGSASPAERRDAAPELDVRGCRADGGGRDAALRQRDRVRDVEEQADRRPLSARMSVL